MTQDEDDTDLLRAWRGAARETPGTLLDRRILAAAGMRAARRRLVPLAAAMAACLALALYAGQWRPIAPAPVAELDTSTFGLYEGRTNGAVADPAVVEQLMVQQAPVGSGAAKGFSP